MPPLSTMKIQYLKSIGLPMLLIKSLNYEEVSRIMFLASKLSENKEETRNDKI